SFPAGPEWHTDEVSEVQRCTYLRQNGSSRSRRLNTQITQDDERSGEDDQGHAAEGTFVAYGFDRASIQPGQYEQNGDGGSHDDKAQELGSQRPYVDGHGAQHGVEGCEIP